MALLKLTERKAIFQALGLGEYNEKNIKAFQKKYMLRKSDWDGVYGTNTDNTLRTVYYTKKYTKNFKPEEFRCECGGKYCCGYPSFMKPAMLKHIQSIRDHYDEPVTVTCGLRCKTWNSKLGGSIQNSLHMKGLAVDFFQSGVTDPLAKRKKSIKWIKKQPNHHYTYGNGINSYGNGISAPYMGNCLHTDVYDNVTPTYPKYKEPKKDCFKVIDVSDWQGQIDWKKIKADKIVGAIIRYADGDTLDTRFRENMANAKKAGLHIGAYIFSRAKTKAEAEKEAERLFNASRDYDADMPLYIDLEAKGLEKYANAVAQAFIAKINALGGKPGVYANLNWWNNYLADTAKKYSICPFWIAQYNSTMDYKPASAMGMWQYTSSGKVDGINGRVDMDKCYVPYWETAPKLPKKSIDDLAREVIDGVWGKDDERKNNLITAGYDYDAVQNKVNEMLEPQLPAWVKKANAWAKKIAKDDSWHYVVWSKDKKTHECPICHDHEKGKFHGWNCIGFSFAYWCHGGGLPCKCSCGVLDNAFMTKLLTMDADEALKQLRKTIGLHDLKLIRNNRKTIPQSKMKPGDLCLMYDGNGECLHIYPYIGDGRMIDCGNWSDVSKQIAERNASPCKVIIRYTGK